jgi:hypothetical protein
MRADIQRKPLGFQEVTTSYYRCVSICVTKLTRSQQILTHSLVLKTTGILEQPFSTSLLQSVLYQHALLKVTLKTLRHTISA